MMSSIAIQTSVFTIPDRLYTGISLFLQTLISTIGKCLDLGLILALQTYVGIALFFKKEVWIIADFKLTNVYMDCTVPK